MLKFIKMKQHEGYLLYYSVIFVVIVVLTVIKSVLLFEVRDKKKIENSSGLHYFMSLVLISAGENLDKKVTYELK